MKILTIFLLSFLGTLGYSQHLKAEAVPAAVLQSFTQAYPRAGAAEWTSENGQFEVNFEYKDAETSVVYDAQGIWQETETEIGLDQLPAAVLAQINREFSEYKLKEAAKIETKNGIQFEAELSRWLKSYDVLFSAEGEVLKSAINETEEAEEAGTEEEDNE